MKEEIAVTKEKKPLTQAELQRIRETSERVRAVAKVIKAVVQQHYLQATFDILAENKDTFNIEGVRFERAAGTTKPASATVSFTIGPQDVSQSPDTEEARHALLQDIGLLFGQASGNTRIESNDTYTGTAIVYGTPEELYEKMQQTIAEHAELRYLLPPTPRRR